MGFFLWINICMALYNADLKPLENGTTHSYEHATRLFLSDNFRLAPKQSFLYYVCINVDQSALQSLTSSLGSEAASSQSLIEQYETGLMAKRVELPRFNVQTRSLKSYNRKNIFQTGIAYEPLSMTFHDDAADTVLKFWNDFYTYYYRDSDYNATLYTVPHKYEARAREGWGYTPRNNNLKPFIRDIQIFSLHHKRFTEYRLINPVITSWRHGEHDSSASNGIMEASMTVDFETVKYYTGYVNPVDVNGFAVIHYDDTPSPISNSTTNIYTDSGLLGAIEGTAQDLARPAGTGSGSGILSSVLDAYRFYNNIKNTNFKQIGSLVLGQLGTQVLGGAINGAINNVFFPTAGTTSQVFPNPSAIGSSPYGIPGNSNLISIAGVAAGVVAGAASGIFNSSSRSDPYNQGVQTSTGPLPNSGYNTVYQVNQGTPYIAIDGQRGQPVSQELTAYNINATTGEILPRFQVQGEQTGGFLGIGSLTTNLLDVVTSTDQNGNTVTTYVYKNGDRASFNSNGEQLSFVPGNFEDTNNTNTNPVTPQEIAASGQVVNTNQVQYAVDPVTGLVYAAGGTTNAYVTNTVTGVPGSSLVFGDGLIGQSVNAPVSGVSGAVVGKATNLLQPIRNPIVGGVSQVVDNVNASIRNVVGSWTGTGGYNPNTPSNNIVSKTINGDGTYTVTFKDGSTGKFNEESGALLESTSSTGGGFFSNYSTWSNNPSGSNLDNSFLSPGFGQGAVVDASGQLNFDYYASNSLDAITPGSSYDELFNWNNDSYNNVFYG